MQAAFFVRGFSIGVVCDSTPDDAKNHDDLQNQTGHNNHYSPIDQNNR